MLRPVFELGSQRSGSLFLSVALIVTSEGEAQRLLPWAWRMAVAERMDLVLLRVQQRDEITALTTIDVPEEMERVAPGVLELWQQLNQGQTGLLSEPAIDESAAEPEELPRQELQLTIKQLSHPHPDVVLDDHLRREGVTLLLLPLDERIREGQGRWKGMLYRKVGCQVVFLRAPSQQAADLKRILVPTAGSENADAALQLACDIGKQHNAKVTALFVERPVGHDSQEVGERILNRNVRKAVGSTVEVEQKVIVADSLIEGVRQEMTDPYDLVLIGALGNRTIRSVFFGSVSNELFSGVDAPAFAAVRASHPVSTKVQEWLKRHLRRAVPQLDREGRIKIVDRVESSSKWDFDFIALTCLSTLIAALGLAGNQAPVIIGAMLVAPLMTPLVGAGLSLVQGNAALIRDSVKSVLFGFLLAFLVGCIVGFVVPMEKVPTEVLNRTHPTLLDLGVALVSGIAAAYAMSRPNLLSALPGVAIAAALVPPIATSGLSVALALSNPGDSYHHWVHALGAVVLFATNIVAIVLGTAFALWAVGIQPPSTGKQNGAWTRWLTVILMLVLVGLGFLVSHNRELESVSDALRSVARRYSENGSTHAVVTDVRRGPSKSELIVDLESDVTDLKELPRELLKSARKTMNNDQLELRLQIRNVIRTSNR